MPLRSSRSDGPSSSRPHRVSTHEHIRKCARAKELEGLQVGKGGWADGTGARLAGIACGQSARPPPTH
eukprot:scaffold28748_cov225-Isochrysis_galbana.AAC.1